MREIYKVDTRSQLTAYGASAALLALPFIGIGAYFALAGFGYLPLPGRVNGPRQILGFVGLAFFVAGCVLFMHGCRGLLERKRAREAERRHFDEPWFLDHAWDPRGVRDRAGGRVLSAVIGMILFGVFLVPFNWWAFFSGEGGLFVTIIVGLFDLILVLVVGTTIYRVMQFMKYGHARLRFRRFPFHPGGKLHVALSGVPRDRLNTTLRFVEERYETSGTGRNRSTRLVSYEHFGKRQEIAEDGGAPEVEVIFDIPDNEEWVTRLGATPVRYWELLVESAQPGIDFRTTFPLPVYPRSMC